MGNLINKSFNKWDYFILIYFSELKLFRYEINKILCEKYTNNDGYNENNKFKNKVKKKSFNLNKLNIILNTIKKNDKSYSFFYSQKNEKNKENETYYIKFILPQIKITYQNVLYEFNTKFDIDIKRLSQINKLRKSFRAEDLIKYSINIIRNKKNEDQLNIDKQNFKKLLSSKKTIKSFLRSSSLVSREREKKNSNTSNKSNSKKKKNNLLDGIKGKIKLSKNYNFNEESIKDIKLNLDKYIFNYDESMLKYIKVKENYKNYNNLYKKKSFNENIIKRNISNKNMDFMTFDKKINIEIGNMELSWTNQDALTKNIIIKKKDSEYLLDHPTFQWKFFIENNIKNYLYDETNIVRPSRRSTKNFHWKDFITKKEE